VPAAETSSAGDRARAPRAPAAEPASAPCQHSTPGAASPGPFPSSGRGMQGTAPASLHPPHPFLFYLFSISQNTGTLKPPHRSSSGWVSRKPPPPLPRAHVPEPPSLGSRPRAPEPAAPASAPRRRHAPSLREATTSTVSAEKFSRQPAPVPPRAGTAAGCTEPPGTGRAAGRAVTAGASLGCPADTQPAPGIDARRVDQQDRQENGFPVAFRSPLR